MCVCERQRESKRALEKFEYCQVQGERFFFFLNLGQISRTPECPEGWGWGKWQAFLSILAQEGVLGVSGSLDGAFSHCIHFNRFELCLFFLFQSAETDFFFSFFLAYS